MPFLFQYLIKLSISLAVLYAFYYLVLRPLTFYQWNRFYLVGYSLLSFVIPFINITDWLSGKKINDSYLLNSIPAVDKLTSGPFNVSKGTDVLSVIASWNFAGLLLLLGSLAMLTRVVYQYLSLRTMKRKAVLLKTGEFEFYDVNGPIAPFSFASSIFINSRLHSEEEFHKILENEFVHVKQKHTIDIVVAEILCVFNWFNPFAWLIRKSIRQNLEFIADNNVLEGGIDSRQYQYLLLKVMGLPQYSITNNFSFSSLKKRIAMMNKMRTARVHLIKFMFVLPLLTVMLLAFRNRMNLNTDPLTLSYAGIIINAANNQPLNNVELREVNTNTVIHTDNNGFFKLSVPAINDKTSLRIHIMKDGTIQKALLVNWVVSSPHLSESFIGLISLDKEQPAKGKCDNCFVYQNQVIDKNGLFVKDISYELAHQSLEDYLQARNDLQILGKTSDPITRIDNRLYISSANTFRPTSNATGFLTVRLALNKQLPLIYKNGAVSSMEKVNATVKGVELKEVEHLTAKAAEKKYGVSEEVIDITTYSGIGTDTIPRRAVPAPPPADDENITKVVTVPVPVAGVAGVQIKSAKSVPAAEAKIVVIRVRPSSTVEKLEGNDGGSIEKAESKKATAVKVTPVNIRLVKSAALDTVNPTIMLGPLHGLGAPLYVVDGKITGEDEFQTIDSKSIKAINVLKGVSALATYGDRATNGVIEVITKDQRPLDVTLTAVSGVEIKGLDDFKGLFIIDGKLADQTQMKKLSPEDIESVTVLKDKESVAIYNENGKNGVILITTKKKVH